MAARRRLFFLGAAGIIAQSAIVRELLIEVRGNELVYAAALTFWLGLTGIGALAGERLRWKKSVTVNRFWLLYLLLLSAAPAGVRILGSVVLPMPGVMPSPGAIILVTFLILIPVCMTGGMLFPLLMRVDGRIGLKHAYQLEVGGIAAGGLFFLLSMFLLPNVAVLWLGLAVIILLEGLGRRSVLFLIPSVLLIFFTIFHYPLLKGLYGTRYSSETLLRFDESPYGRLETTITKGTDPADTGRESYNEALIYRFDGKLINEGGEERFQALLTGFVRLLLDNSSVCDGERYPENILVIGGLLQGIPQAVSRAFPQCGILCLEADRNILQASGLPSQDFPDIQTIRQDPSGWLRDTSKRFGLVISLTPEPEILLQNRYATVEYFRLLQRVLDSSGVAVVTFPGDANFAGPDLGDASGFVLRSFQAVFPVTRLVPGNQTLFFGTAAAKAHPVLRAYGWKPDIDSLIARGEMLALWQRHFGPETIYSSCNMLRINQFLWTSARLSGTNTASDPQACTRQIVDWLRRFGSGLGSMIDFVRKWRWSALLIAMIVVLGFALIADSGRKGWRGFPSGLLFTASLLGFLLQLIALYIFQQQHGRLFSWIPAFFAVFMTGFLLGMRAGKLSVHLVPLIFALTGMFLLLGLEQTLSPVIYLGLNGIAALAEGRLIAHATRSIDSAGGFYFIDNTGAMLGGVFFSLMFPLLGMNSLLHLVYGISVMQMIFLWMGGRMRKKNLDPGFD